MDCGDGASIRTDSVGGARSEPRRQDAAAAEFRELERRNLRRAARSTALLLDPREIRRKEPDRLRLDAPSLSVAHNVCPNETFAGQPSAGFCSAVLVGPRLLLTAGHCIRNRPECRATRALFGYHIDGTGSRPRRFESDDLYSCASIETQRDDGSGLDYTLIRLDRPVRDRAPLPLRRSTSFQPESPLEIVGYPAGAPVKIRPSHPTRRTTSEAILHHRARTLDGDSGAPIVDPETGIVEAIHVRGPGALVESERRDCRLRNRCAQVAGATDCDPGEGLLVPRIAGSIPPLSGARALRIRGRTFDPGPGRAAAARFVVPSSGPVEEIRVEARVRTEEHTPLRVRITRTIPGRGGEARTAIETVPRGRHDIETEFGPFGGREGEGIWRVRYNPLDGAAIELERSTLWLHLEPPR